MQQQTIITARGRDKAITNWNSFNICQSLLTYSQEYAQYGGYNMPASQSSNCNLLQPCFIQYCIVVHFYHAGTLNLLYILQMEPVRTWYVLLLCLANLDCSLGGYIATLNMLSLNWVPKHISDILRHTLYEKVNGKWQTCKITNNANESSFVIYPTS